MTPAAGAPSAPSSSAAASSAPASSAPARKDGAACAEDQITLTPVVDERVYAATDDPQIAMTIENTGSNSCHMDLGSAQQVLTITSGTEQYWTSKDCQTGGTNQDVTLKAGQELTTPAITWDRTRSSATTCDAARAAVPAGGASYHLQVTVGGDRVGGVGAVRAGVTQPVVARWWVPGVGGTTKRRASVGRRSAGPEDCSSDPALTMTEVSR
ncbi:hypothetical protein [Curtobacterium sp. MCJR17_043]|uniref:hypothetical protein n=1 Tax=Curtobacterium sp. MCJR17_043 TaxID=2175660 RepID=UPI0024DF3BBE|nr:hypothetical protein [Curtobacterium sp. MCJR17_043]WIB36178.1 hypothetical protein DEJ15_02895 [Curtobacterium sp. MCJR17_043]